MTTPENSNSDFDAISLVLEQYFMGLYQGDVEKLNVIFHEGTWLKAPNVRRSLNTWLNDVRNRPNPAEIGALFSFKILSLDIVNDQAMAKVYCPLFDFHYIDFLGFLKENGQEIMCYLKLSKKRARLEIAKSTLISAKLNMVTMTELTR